jgi:hypothetical protein
MPAATGLAATKNSYGSRARRCSGFARMPASVPWSGFGNGSGAGEEDTAGIVVPDSSGVRDSRESQEMSLPY